MLRRAPRMMRTSRRGPARRAMTFDGEIVQPAGRMAAGGRRRAGLFGLRRAFAFRLPGVEQKGLDLAVELDRERAAMPVHRPPGLDADPAFGDAIFLDVVALAALEADADAPAQQLGVEPRAARIEGQAVGKRIGHGKLSDRLSASL